MKDMFKCFMNPADGKYAWVDLDECKVAVLQDFRWHSDNIFWNQILLLLEGQNVHLPRQRNLFPSDMEIPCKNIIPFFATSKAFGIQGNIQHTRWKRDWNDVLALGNFHVPPQNTKGENNAYKSIYFMFFKTYRADFSEWDLCVCYFLKHVTIMSPTLHHKKSYKHKVKTV